MITGPPITKDRSSLDMPDVEPSETRTERHRREVFERLVEATRKLMFTRALDDATVQEITDSADLGKGTFFNYFPTKEHVIPAIIRERYRQLEKTIEDVKSGELTARQALIDYFINLAWDAHGGDWLTFYGSILRSLTHNEEIRTEVSERIRIRRLQLEALVAIGQERGEFRSDYAAETLSIYVERLMFGITLVSWINRKTPGIRQEDALMRLVIESIVTPGWKGSKKAPRKSATKSKRASGRTAGLSATPPRRPLNRSIE